MQQNEQHSYWRSDITGLRALAVLPVLIFHAWPNILPGGFVGVDVFFVISGYLISGILFRQLQRTGSIDFFDFYAKRIRRIIPNLLCVLLFTVAVGWFFMTPNEYMDLGKQIYSSAFFYQNFRLLKELGDYFANDASREPLLHLWSLAIEEQFYIVFPVLCALVWKLKTKVRTLGSVVLLVTAGSFLMCLLVHDQTFRFYFPLTRFWELGVGIVISYMQHFGFWRPETQTALKSNLFSFLGAGFLVFSFFCVREQNFPGLEALLPTFGAVLILASSPKAVFNRFLACQPVVFVGLISYSLYLWHWPLIAYANIIEPMHETWVNGLLLVVGFVLSVLAYLYVETPFRTLKVPKVKTRAVAGLLAGLVVVTLVGQGVRLEHGFPTRNLHPALQEVAAIQLDKADRKNFYVVNIDGARIEMNRKTGVPAILFVGDSHMAQYVYRVEKIAEKKDVSIGILVGGACWITPGHVSDDEGCNRKIKDFERLLSNKEIKHVVLGQKWGSYFGKDFVFDENGMPVRFVEGQWVKTLRNLQKYFEGNGRTLHVILDAPWDESENKRLFNPVHYFSRIHPEKIESIKVSIPKDPAWRMGNDAVKSILGHFAKIIDPVSQVCPHEQCDLLRYRDDDHLRASYLRDHAVWIDSIFDDVRVVHDKKD